MKSTRETQDLKEELARKEQIKQAAKKRQEQLQDLEAKKKIKAQIEADKAERKRKQEEAKAAREGRAVEQAAAPAPVAPAPKPAAAAHTQARLAFQTPNGNFTETYPADTTLFEVAQQIGEKMGFEPNSFMMTFPTKTFERDDFNLTLKEAKLTPSARLIVK